MGVNPRVDDGPQDLGCIATSLMGYVFFTECTCYRYSSQNVHVIVTRLLWLARLFRLDVRGCRSSVCLMLVRILGSRSVPFILSITLVGSTSSRPREQPLSRSLDDGPLESGSQLGALHCASLDVSAVVRSILTEIEAQTSKKVT